MICVETLIVIELVFTTRIIFSKVLVFRQGNKIHLNLAAFNFH